MQCFSGFPGILLLLLACVWTVASQDSSPLPACGQTCVTNMLAQGSALGCANGDVVCYCTNANFEYGVRDCANEACPNASEANATIAYAEAYCSAASSSTSGTSVSRTAGTTSTIPSTFTSVSLLSQSSPSTVVASIPVISTSHPLSSSATSSSSSPSSSLSTGAKIGIGIGVPIGVILLSMNIALLVIVARRRKKAEAETDGAVGAITVQAQAGHEETHEIDGRPVNRHELPTKANTAEMEALKEKPKQDDEAGA